MRFLKQKKKEVNNFVKTSEKNIENSILDFLSYQKNIFAFKVNTMGVFDRKINGYRRLSKHVIPGTPDIIACVNVNGLGVFCAFEVKSKTGKQSIFQKAFEQNILKRGCGFYFIVRSVEEVQIAISKIGNEVRSELDGKISL